MSLELALRESAKESAKLKMITVRYGPVLFDDPIKAKFEEVYRDVNVNITYAPYSALHDGIVSAMREGCATYDVFVIDNI